MKDVTDSLRIFYLASVTALFLSFAIGFATVVWREGRPPGILLRHLEEGILLVERGDHSEAVKRLRVATRIAPDDDSARYLLGIALQHSGDLGSAKAAYQQVLKLEPWHIGAHFRLGLIHLEQQNLEAAIWHNQIAIRLQPENAHALTNLAVALLRQGKTEEAVQHLRAALRAHPGFPPAQNTLDQIHAQKSASAK